MRFHHSTGIKVEEKKLTTFIESQIGFVDRNAVRDAAPLALVTRHAPGRCCDPGAHGRLCRRDYSVFAQSEENIVESKIFSMEREQATRQERIKVLERAVKTVPASALCGRWQPLPQELKIQSW